MSVTPWRAKTPGDEMNQLHQPGYQRGVRRGHAAGLAMITYVLPPKIRWHSEILSSVQVLTNGVPGCVRFCCQCASTFGSKRHKGALAAHVGTCLRVDLGPTVSRWVETVEELRFFEFASLFSSVPAQAGSKDQCRECKYRALALLVQLMDLASYCRDCTSAHALALLPPRAGA